MSTISTEQHKLIDSHCHLDMTWERGLSEEETFRQMKDTFTEGLIQIAAHEKAVYFAKELSIKKIPIEYHYTIGFHPGDVGKENESACIELAQESKDDPKFVAVGEIGLDYYYAKHTKKKQISTFEKYIQLAEELKKPICIHTRDAGEDTVSILKNCKKDQRILIHCFTGNLAELNSYLELGCYISFSGIVTFKNADAIKEAAMKCPAEKMLVETDAPFLAPTPFRGKVNQPGYVRYTLDHIASLKEMNPYLLGEFTYQNTKEFYGLE